MITARYANKDNTYIIVTFSGRSVSVPCDINNALYRKVINEGIQILPYEDSK